MLIDQLLSIIDTSGLIDFGGKEVISVTLSEEAGAVSCVEIPIADDSIFESVEDFQVELTTPDNVPAVQLGTISIATVLIDDLG